MTRSERRDHGGPGRGGRTAAFALLAAGTLLPGAARAQAARPAAELDHCSAAERFLSGTAEMATRTEPDTLDDWRTHRRLPGCRVTAAGATSASAEVEAPRFFESLRQAGWARTPEPRDAPNEASLRFRMGASDCLFNFYTGGLLGTDAEFAVDAERVPRPGEMRYNILALCVPALEAAR